MLPLQDGYVGSEDMIILFPDSASIAGQTHGSEDMIILFPDSASIAGQTHGSEDMTILFPDSASIEPLQPFTFAKLV
jgi:hypothetical protein